MVVDPEYLTQTLSRDYRFKNQEGSKWNTTLCWAQPADSPAPQP